MALESNRLGCLKHAFRTGSCDNLAQRRFQFQKDLLSGSLDDLEISPGERGALIQAQCLVVAELFCAIEEQEAESISRPAIVLELLIQPGLLHERLVVNRGDLRSELGGVLQFRVIGFDAPLERIDQRHRTRPKIQDLQGAAVRGFDDRRGLRRCQLDFFPAVRVKIEPRDRPVRFLAVLERIRDRLGAHEFAPQFPFSRCGAYSPPKTPCQ